MGLSTGSVVVPCLNAIFSQPISEVPIPAGATSEFDWIRVGVLILVIGFGFLLTFYVIYPSALKRSRSLMPLTLYGQCLGGLILVIQGVVLVLYWREFVWGDSANRINEWPKVAWVVVMILSWVLSAAFFKTPRPIRS
jgi:hypothetical protein